MNNINFKGMWIPKEIWFAEDISFLEKCLLVQIDALTTKEAGCYASNAYFSELFQMDARSLQRHLKVLNSKGYIRLHFKNPTNRTGRTIYTYMSQQVKCPDNSDVPGTSEVSHHATAKVSQVVISSNNKEKNKPPLPPGELTPFELFWEAYPKKTNKGSALKAFKAQKVNGNLKQIIDDVKLRSSSDDWMKENGQFIPYPATYLNNRKWEEEKQESNPDPF